MPQPAGRAKYRETKKMPWRVIGFGTCSIRAAPLTIRLQDLKGFPRRTHSNPSEAGGRRKNGTYFSGRLPCVGFRKMSFLSRTNGRARGGTNIRAPASSATSKSIMFSGLILKKGGVQVAYLLRNRGKIP